MTLSNRLLYFQYTTNGLFENMIWPTVLNFIGPLMLYSFVAAFGMKSLPSRYLPTFVFLMIWMRNSIAPVIGTSIYSNWVNERQQYHITVPSEEMTASNPSAANAHVQNMAMAKASGKGTSDVEQFSSIAMKEITGYSTLS